MKYCTNCGCPCKEEARFCEQCGKPLNDSNFAYNNNNNQVYSDKSRLACGLLQIFLGSFGIGRFYSGHTGMAIAQLLVSIFTFGIGSIWGLIDGILILTNKEFKDAQGRIMKD